MNVTIIEKEAFSVIGKEGSTIDNPKIVKLLWQQANEHFDEVSQLALKNKEGRLDHVWGLMSDIERKLLPWTDNFSKGLYLAGVETDKNASVPEGWVKWDIPKRTYMVIEIEDGDYGKAFEHGIHFELYYRRYRLSGAVCDYSDITSGKDYLYFPVENNPGNIYEEKTTDMIACCGIHCKYCFFDGACKGCMNEPNECSYGYHCEQHVCKNIRCAKEKGIEGCYDCTDVMNCTTGFFKSSPYGKVMAEFIRQVGKERFEEAIKKMIALGYNYSKDLEEMNDEQRMAFMHSLLEK